MKQETYKEPLIVKANTASREETMMITLQYAASTQRTMVRSRWNQVFTVQTLSPIAVH